MSKSKGKSENKEKLTVRTPSMVEKAVRNKWLLYGGIGVAVIWFFAMSALGERERAPRVRPPEFRDVMPDVRATDARAFARMQTELREAQKEAAERDAKHLEALQALQKAMEEERAERDQQLERMKQEQEEQLAQTQRLLEQQIQKNRQAPTQPSSKSEDDGSFSSYLRPPRIDDGSVPPPPTLVRESRSGDGQQSRAQLPPRESHKTITTPQGAAQRTEPIVLDSTSDVDDPRILRGPEIAEKEKDKTDHVGGLVPAGSFADVALITGADFGASDRTQANPQPVLMRVQADAILPGRARYEMTDCFALGSGYGELSSERAYIQLARISCVETASGQILESPLQGYLVDSDGRLGLRGIVSRRSGILLGKAMLAGFAEGASKILSSAASGAEQTITGSGVITTIDPSRLGEVGLYGGAGRAAEIIADQYIKEAENMFPVIEVDAGRRATLVVQIGQKLEWKPYTDVGAQAEG